MVEINWYDLDASAYWIEKAWVCGRDGLVVAVENVAPNGVQVVTLPENFHEDDRPIDYIDTEAGSVKEATEIAKEYMENYRQ